MKRYFMKLVSRVKKNKLLNLTTILFLMIVDLWYLIKCDRL